MEEIITKIIKYYSGCLTSEDKVIIENNPSEEFVRKIVNRIWGTYLTDSFNYRKGKDFRYLVIDDKTLPVCNSFMAMDYPQNNYKISDYPEFKTKKHQVKLFTNTLLSKGIKFTTGYIVNVNWETTDRILLPEDFIGKDEELTFSDFDPVALYSIHSGEEIISPSYDNIQSLASESELLFLGINRREYITNYKLSDSDLEQITKNFINLYCFRKRKVNINRQDDLLLKYHDYVKANFKKAYSKDDFSAKKFIKFMFDYLDKSENVISHKL
jgi:hypothetical protein